MDCPHCRHKEADGALECSKCNFIFAKWSAAKAVRGRFEEGGVHPWVYLVVVAALAAAWVIRGLGAEPAAGADPDSMPVKKVMAKAQGGAASAWRFQGKVTDLLRQGPIKGVKVSFVDWETGRVFSATTEDDGRYGVDVDVRWKRGYAAEVVHPLYVARSWPGAAADLPRAERLKMGFEPAPEGDSPVYRGAKSGETALDFSLYPADLTQDEKREAGR
ncbi:MAG: carboxypeptidase-like regulatory domain-containing protein [Elusimicrobiota bacterium]